MKQDTRPKVERTCTGAEEAVVVKISAKVDGAKGRKVEQLKRNQQWTGATEKGNKGVDREIGEPYEVRASRTVLEGAGGEIPPAYQLIGVREPQWETVKRFSPVRYIERKPR